jgi:hypothetical protein
VEPDEGPIPAPVAWAIEGALNPTVLRLHVNVSLTERTIVTCPPSSPPAPLDSLLLIDGVRSVDLHRYHVRINLLPGGGRGHVSGEATAALSVTWGPPVDLPEAGDPRAFGYPRHGRRVVAESLEMARAAEEPVLERLFRVPGVAETIAGEDMVLVRLGRLFGWHESEAAVREALADVVS